MENFETPIDGQVRGATGMVDEEKHRIDDLTLKIDGMTCGHCVNSVTEELSAVPGVSSVDVVLSAGGTSTATITADAAIENSILEAAVAEAGYSLVSLSN